MERLLKFLGLKSAFQNSQDGELNISDRTPRVVKCTYLTEQDDSHFPNSALLVIGMTYHVIKIDIQPEQTYVRIQEFPGLDFNSRHFSEILET